MERSLAGVLFLVSAVALSIAAGGWWMQRVVFTPDGATDSAEAILEDADIRQELNSVITPLSAPVIGADPTGLGLMLEDYVLTSRAGAAVMAPLIEEIHDLIIGNTEGPIVITGSDLIPIVRDEHAAEVPDITLPIETIGTLETAKTFIGWMIPIAAGLGLLLLILGIFTRPERRDILRGLGEFCIAMAVSMLLFGYLIPVHLLVAIDNRTWTHAIPQLALRTLPAVFGSIAVFAVGGVALILASNAGGKRRQWSTPLSVARYQGGDNPGWR